VRAVSRVRGPWPARFFHDAIGGICVSALTSSPHRFRVKEGCEFGAQLTAASRRIDRATGDEHADLDRWRHEFRLPAGIPPVAQAGVRQAHERRDPGAIRGVAPTISHRWWQLDGRYRLRFVLGRLAQPAVDRQIAVLARVRRHGRARCGPLRQFQTVRPRSVDAELELHIGMPAGSSLITRSVMTTYCLPRSGQARTAE
jgi:hypothetical protein